MSFQHGHIPPSNNPSPPPIATISHSPALSTSSLDRSSVSSPPPRRSSLHTPPVHSTSPFSTTPASAFSGTSPGTTMHQIPTKSASHHSPNQHHNHISARSNGAVQPQPSYAYGTPSTPSHFDPRYDSTPSNLHHNPHSLPHSSHHHHSHIPPSYHHSAPHYPFVVQPTNMIPQPGVPNGRDGYSIAYPLPGQSHSHIIHTDDATTKLSERVRRRCFNCCTTDTSTWRRSNLSPGKVLCNKCGLFERTHSRPRPEQFPHKRGPLASSTMRSRNSPPSAQQLHQNQHQHHQQPQASSSSSSPSPALPPISNHTLPVHQYTHQTMAPLPSLSPDSRRQSYPSPALTASTSSTSTALPEIQSWLHNAPTASASSSASSTSSASPVPNHSGAPTARRGSAAGTSHQHRESQLVPGATSTSASAVVPSRAQGDPPGSPGV